MLESFLADIYEKALALDSVKKVSFYSNIRDPYKCVAYWNEASVGLNKILDDLKDADPGKKEDLYKSVLLAINNAKDLPRFSGIIDVDIIPKLMDYLNNFTGIDVTENEWTLESSSTAFLTLKRTDGAYIHSISDPMWESFIYAYDIYKPEIRRYNIFGCGLGYLAYQLWKISDKEADIYIYETDEKICEYADMFGVLSLIDSENVHVICDEDKDKVIESFFEAADDNDSFSVIYYLDNNYDGIYSDQLLLCRSVFQTERVFDQKWKNNYSRNSSFDHSSISDFDLSKLHDEWVVVAAGPSLNDNEDFIRQSIGKRTICAINASLKWFSKNSIKPDLCTACDPSDSLLPHIDGVEEFSSDIPLVTDCITNYKYVKQYRGPRYYVYSDSSYKLSDESVDKNAVWTFGGTVTSMALEAAYKLGAKRIYLIGADLGYPDGITYAKGVGHDVGKWEKNEKSVVSVDDRMIPTSLQFYEYKYQIEEQIKNHPDVEVINRSLHGAYLKGSYCDKWWENIPDGSEERFIQYFDGLLKDSLILGWKEKYYLFLQTVCKMKKNNAESGNEVEAAVNNAYKNIFSAFKDELDLHGTFNAHADNNLIYIFTDEFWDESDEHTLNVLNIAKSESQKSKKVFIVNTSEKLGGNMIPVYNAVPAHYNSHLEKESTVKYENRIFSYFQFSKGMPDIDHYRVFLESMSRRTPGKIYITSQYSLLADYCAQEMNIKAEHKFK